MPVAVLDIFKHKIKPIRLPKAYEDFFEVLPSNEQWTMGVAGEPSSGKSSFLLAFAGILAKSGKVLYGNFEENVKGGTIQVKAREMGYRPRMKYYWALQNVKFLDNVKLSALENELASGDYKYCIIDSVSDLLARNKISLSDALDIKEKFPNIAFIYVLHFRKDATTYKGDSALGHLFDIFVLMRKGGIASFFKNRFKTKTTANVREFHVFKNKLL